MEKNKYHRNINVIILVVVSLILTIFFVGQNNLWLSRVDWLYGHGDLTNAQLSWQYFQHDKWHFPIGKNPSYGLEISNSIVFTDNIPLFAIFFKILNPFLPDKFQYYSLWIFICLFLQLYFSYILLEKTTLNKNFSLFASFLLLLVPFLFFRLSHHFSLGAHWLILYSFYTVYFIEEKNKNFHWFVLIALSLLIHLYFTVMIFIIYGCSLLEIYLKRKNIKIFFGLLLKILFALVLMYVIGYFESSPVNSVSSGYGEFKMDLFSFLDPKIPSTSSWSYFLNDINITHLEGFIYLGLGNIILISFAFILFLKNREKNKSKKNNFPFLRIANLYIVIFFLWSLTTNFSVYGNKIFSLNLPDYLFGLLSIFSSTGRFAWPVVYILILYALIYVFKNLKKFNFSVILICLVIQIFDITLGLYNNSLANNKTNNYQKLDPIWGVIENNYDKIRTTYLYNNYGPIFIKLSKILGNLKNIETDIILNASMDRKKAAEVRYNLINKINQNELDNNTAYIIDNIGHLVQLKKIFENKDVGFFKRDNFWIMLPDKKSIMTEKDKNNLNKINTDTAILNKKYELMFKKNFQGFGWTHNFGEKGIWTEGERSFLLFKLPNSEKKIDFILDIQPYISNKKKDQSLEILINKNLKKQINFFENKKSQKIKFVINPETTRKDIIIEFKNKGLISPYDIFESPDARKLGVLLKSIEFR